MNERWLYLSPEGLDDADTDWPVLHWQAGDVDVRHSRLEGIAQALQGAPVVLVLPMELVGWCLSSPLAGRRRPGAQALAFAVEEQLGEPLESLHLVFGAARADRCYPAMSIDRQRFKSVLTQVQAQGIYPVAVYADADLLPREQPCALWFCGRWLVGGDMAGRLALSSVDAATLAPSLPSMSWWIDANAPEGLPQGSTITSAHALLIEGRKSAIDLRQGEFRRRRRALPWSGLLLSLAAFGLLSSVFDHLRTAYLQTRSMQLHEQSVQRFQSLYPDQTRIVDLAAQFQARQRQERAPEKTRLQQLAEVSEKLVESGNVRIGRIEMQSGEGWQMHIIAQDFSDLERLRERLPSLNVSSASKTGEGVRATLSWEQPG
ncbi:type II secretion system protein GspL [Pseudomonas akapageensis]|uniref:type II secretion system protein GspL n=1 Tax=Pseudomonas akapageensis TaxID=2609961 RepID=UPI001409C077|nr:type II secretion system protein GspL [Pseudomonas akapageensis]